MQQIKISEVILDDRIRRDYGAVDELADSICQYGFIHPPAIDQNKTLVAGGRRFTAIGEIMKREPKEDWHETIKQMRATGVLELGITFSFKPTISVDHLGELELEENVQRKQMSWQEYCIGVAKVHKLKQNKAALNSESWGNRQTANLFKISNGKVAYVLEVAKHLTNNDSPLWHCDSITDAIQRLAALKLEEYNRAIASQSVANLPKQNDLAAKYTDKSRPNDDFFTVTPRTVDLASEFSSFAAPNGKAAAPAPSGDGLEAAGGAGGLPPAEDRGAPAQPAKTVIDLKAQLTNLPLEQFNFIKANHNARLVVALTDFDHEIPFYQPSDRGFTLCCSPRVDCLKAEIQHHPLIYVDTGKAPDGTGQSNIEFRKNFQEFYFAYAEDAKLANFQNSSVHFGTSEADRLLFGNDFSVYPDSFWTWILNAFCKRGDTVICARVGSGSLIRSCIKLGIKFICNEPDFKLYQKAYQVASNTYMQILPNVEIEPLH
jgi:ParB family chromosome partitioning protein